MQQVKKIQNLKDLGPNNWLQTAWNQSDSGILLCVLNEPEIEGSIYVAMKTCEDDNSNEICPQSITDGDNSSLSRWQDEDDVIEERWPERRE